MKLYPDTKSLLTFIWILVTKSELCWKKLSFLIYITDVKNHFLTNANGVQISLHLKQMIGDWPRKVKLSIYSTHTSITTKGKHCRRNTLALPMLRNKKKIKRSALESPPYPYPPPHPKKPPTTKNHIFRRLALIQIDIVIIA